MKQLLSFFILFCALSASAQKDGDILDGVVAVVGEELLLQSELEERYNQMVSNGFEAGETTRCQLLEEMLFGKLLLAQSKVDSVEVGDAQVEIEIDRRLRYFVGQFGSEEQLEKFYNKSLVEIKEEFRSDVKEQMIIQQMQQIVSGDILITPKEVKEFYKKIPEDSLPFINAEIQVAQIVKKAPVGEAEKKKTKAKLEAIRDRVLKGEDFGTLAFLYSEDPGSAQENGDLGFVRRGDLVPEFAGVAFKLEVNEISEIVETKFGFHLIKLLEKRGQKVRPAHILLIPKVQPEDMIKAKVFIDSVKTIIQTVDSIDFETAAKLFSDDKQSKYNGGLVSNQFSGGTRFEMDQISQIDPGLFIVVEKMKVGEISDPEVAQLQDGSKGYRLVKMVDYRKPHRANLKDDYQRISDAARNEKRQKTIEQWIEDSKGDFFIRLDDQFSSCKMRHQWPTNP